MNFFKIAVAVTLLLPLVGCDAKSTESNSLKVAVSTQTKELSPEESFTKLQMEAEAGNANAQSNLGRIYEAGDGVPKDAVKAVEWYQKAAVQGNAVAQSNLG